MGMLLVRVHSPRQHVTLNAGVISHDPFAGHKGRLTNHILACRITSGVVKTQVAHTRRCKLLNIAQLARPSSGLSLFGNLVKIFGHPNTKVTGLASIVKHKYWGALHSVVYHSHLGTTRFTQQSCATIIASNQRAFASGHRHIKITLGMFTIN
ncbi:MAG: Uncharacterised protein [SAR92 bacterium MED-G29]|nr:MAG: Uncharacterised protein [SAR92 bacterium MED-G29]